MPLGDGRQRYSCDEASKLHDAITIHRDAKHSAFAYGIVLDRCCYEDRFNRWELASKMPMQSLTCWLPYRKEDRDYDMEYLPDTSFVVEVLKNPLYASQFVSVKVLHPNPGRSSRAPIVFAST